ncbi:hypothetical protein VP01_36g10 [Puccinia sorghi]|uniref:Uncharacterized protein n=1 Tax=Puccinia sorghi TaxID=27349 RepID=A0A0L6UU66_9BASI|nr:hypothetical protein VP01_36g10 [Puccinia sorghi]
MVFQSYAPVIRITMVRMLLDGKSQNFICNSFGYSISHQSFECWMDLFEQTKCVVCDPEMYTQGPTATLTNEEIDFISDLAIHNNLVNNLCIILKKAETSNFRKFLVAKYTFIKRINVYPADWLVFTSESSSF